MTINIYDYNIISPAKCGSRYLDTIYGTEDCPTGKTIVPPNSKLNSSSMIQIKKVINSSDIESVDGIKWIIIRPPIELTHSAIHTEMLMCWNKKFDNTDYYNEDNVVNNLVDIDKSTGVQMCGHYDFNLYRKLCFKWMQSDKKIKFVHLKDLSEFASEYLLPKPPSKSILKFEKEMYDFHNWDIWFSKQDVLTYVQRVYPTHWDMIKRHMVKETFFWETLVRDAEFYIPPTIN